MKHSVEEIILKNGARGLFIDIPTASVMNTKFQFRAGMRYAKSEEVYEIAHVVEHLAFGANAKYRNEQAYEADFTKNGAYHNAWTSDFSVCYESECADFEWDRILELKQIAIASPRFNQEELDSEKSNIKTELTGYMNDYSRLIWPRLQRAVGEDVPNLKQRLTTVNNIELKDIREHYRRTHTANNLRFVIAGRIKRRRRQLVRLLSDWELKSGERFAIPRDELHASAPILIRRKDASNLSFGFTWITPRKLEPNEIHAMGCLNHILTGTTSSKIFGQARKKGLVYGLGSALNAGPHSTAWDFDGEVNLENSEALFKLIREELIKLLNGELLVEEITAAKSYLLGRYQMGAQTVSQIADYYADNYFASQSIEKYDHLPQLIQSIDKDTILRLAREFIDNKIHAFVAVSSAEKAIINGLASQLDI